MNLKILNTAVQDFLDKNLRSDLMSILLREPDFEGIGAKELVEQIEAKARCQKKLPTWFHTPGIYYPNKLNIEQTSSEITAQYKSALVNGERLVDLSGGFGVDSYYFSGQVENVTHCEWDERLSQIAQYNFKVLGKTNINAYVGDGLAYLRGLDRKVDWLFIDPSRRNEAKGKVFLLSDCLPNVPGNLDVITASAQNIMIKTSPILDISAGLMELRAVFEIHIVAVRNEVKELLWILKPGFEGEPILKTINVTPKGAEGFHFYRSDEQRATSEYAAPGRYLYEPNAAILKSGAFKYIGEAYRLYKLQEHSHLYTSDSLIDFPGRRFRIEEQLPFNKKTVRGLRLSQANITTRNFPFSVPEIRKRFAIKDGGTTYLFFTTTEKGQKEILRCTPI